MTVADDKLFLQLQMIWKENIGHYNHINCTKLIDIIFCIE